MATDLSSAPVVPQPAPYQQHAYNKSAQFTPMGSGANTPLNISPTSPRTVSHLPLHTQHAPPIRPLKTPNYVPAALRKTEKPVRQSPPKVDSGNDAPTGSWNVGSPFGQGAGEVGRISRIATEDLHSIYNDVPLSPTSSKCTQNHWQPDNSTKVCTASSCQQPFGFFVRKHHCRKCGAIFCWQHSQKKVRLNEHALFHPEGHWQRACDRCHLQFREWEQLRSSRANSESSSGSTSAVQIDTPQAKRPEAHRGASLATSFGGNWNWSTF